MPAPHRSVFTGRMPFLPPNQQRQSPEGKSTEGKCNIMTTSAKYHKVKKLQIIESNHHHYYYYYMNDRKTLFHLCINQSLNTWLIIVVQTKQQLLYKKKQQ